MAAVVYPVRVKPTLDEPLSPLAVAGQVAPRHPALRRPGRSCGSPSPSSPSSRSSRSCSPAATRGRSSTSTSACCAGPGGSPTTPTARWAPTGTRRSAWTRCRTTRPTLDVAYPERLSRGLVLVKWWLLAIPQYAHRRLCSSAGAWSPRPAAREQTDRLRPRRRADRAAGVLRGDRACCSPAATREALYDFVLGMNRWVLRVAAYAALMTDAYPPFRLDMGGDEPGDTLTVPAPAQVPAPTTATPQDRPPFPAAAGRPAARYPSSSAPSWCWPRSACSGPAASGRGWTAVQRDASGFVPLGTQTYSSSGYAVSTDTLHVYGVSTGWGAVSSMIGDVRISAESTGPGRTTFVGLAPSGLASGYLHGVAYSTVSRIGSGPTLYVEHLGTAPAVPTTVDIWTASASGPGTQTLVWSPSDGDWTIMAPDPDASRGVAVSAQVSARRAACPRVGGSRAARPWAAVPGGRRHHGDRRQRARRSRQPSAAVTASQGREPTGG